RSNPLYRVIFILFCLLFIEPDFAFAVNFYDGSRAKQGTYFLTYTSLYTADEITNKNGNVSRKDFGLFSAQEMLRLCYYSPDFVATALVPFGYMEIKSLDQDSSGLGDINLGAGYFLPVKQVDILPMLFVKFPTGEYHASKSANIGSNQYDIKPMFFLHKTLGDFSIDASAKYHFRLKNEKTNVLPGDEFYLQLLLGYKVTEKFKLGPSFNWMISGDKEQNGIKVKNSGRENVSVGADFYYRFSWLSVTLTYLYDVYTENSPQGHFLQLKTVYRF
ncbi:MAG: transporter, partial [Smithella sp.]|nr:transporter [Smithella sp.]